MWLRRILALAMAATLPFADRVSAATVVVSGDVATNTTWFATNTYLLQTVVYVKSNVSLTIEAGTVIKGGRSNLIARTGMPNLGPGPLNPKNPNNALILFTNAARMNTAYVIESSIDLQDWTPIITNSSMAAYVETNMLPSWQFYRARRMD
jgi:hypothetical protein